MPFASLRLLGGIIAVDSTQLRGFHILTVHTSGTGSRLSHALGVAPLRRLLSNLRYQQLVDLGQQTVVPPLGEIVVGSAFADKVVRQKPPLTAGPIQIAERVDHFA